MRDSYQEDVIVYQIALKRMKDYPIVVQDEVRVLNIRWNFCYSLDF